VANGIVSLRNEVVNRDCISDKEWDMGICKWISYLGDRKWLMGIVSQEISGKWDCISEL
jgi:hypothetical protein